MVLGYFHSSPAGDWFSVVSHCSFTEASGLLDRFKNWSLAQGSRPALFARFKKLEVSRSKNP
jgi:hypothetical protein